MHTRRPGLPVLVFTAAAAVSTALAGALDGALQGRERQVFVSVVDADGAPVTGLSAEDFIVREDGVAREVLRVSRATDPMQIALLIDDTQAATRAIQDLRKGLERFVAEMHERNEIALITFGERPTIVVDYTSTPAQLTAGINRLFARPGTGSYLLEAIVEASRGIQRREASRPVMIVVTTEGPEFSNDHYQSVLEALHRSQATLHALILAQPGEADVMSDEVRNRNVVLAEGTETTGGRRDYLLTELAIAGRFEQLAAELRNQYKVTYGRPDSLIPPSKLAVTVRIKGATARATQLAGGR